MSEGGIGDCSDPVLVDLSQDLAYVERKIEFCFANMRSPEAASMAVEALREYRGRLEDAASAYIHSQIGMGLPSR